MLLYLSAYLAERARYALEGVSAQLLRRRHVLNWHVHGLHRLHGRPGIAQDVALD